MAEPSSLATVRPAVEALLAEADDCWRRGDSSRIDQALSQCDRALALLQETGRSPEAVGWAGRTHMSRGHLWEAKGDFDSAVQALRSYEQAIGLWQSLLIDGEIPLDLAGAWMNRGNILQKIGSPEALAEAARSYEQTLALLKNCPADAPINLHLMAGASWLNRGSTLQRIGGEAEFKEALQSFDQAITILQPHAAAHEAARRHWSYALTNRGLTLQQLGRSAEAIRAHEEALAAGSPDASDQPEAAQAEHATLRLHLGQALWADKQSDAALAELRLALAEAAPLERHDPRASDTSLRARHTACTLLGAELAGESSGSPGHAQRLAEASDWVEEGLELFKAWSPEAVWLRATALRLFEFGAWLYRTQQPKFLAEFLQDYTQPDDPEWARVARSTIGAARHDMIQGSFAHLFGEHAERTAETLRIFTEVEAAIASADATARPPA